MVRLPLICLAKAVRLRSMRRHEGVAPCGYDLDGAARLASELCARRALPSGIPVWAVDADAALVRPGPRLIDGVDTLAGIAHPGYAPALARRGAPSCARG